jgi:hypothetical protein
MSYFSDKRWSMKIFQFIIFLFLLNVAPVWSQSHYILDNLSAIKDKNRVIINWTIKRGNSCIGIGIFRSIDSTNYELIGEIQGICGSTEFAQAFHFIDENPVKNKTNYYVLELGFSGKSEPPLKVEYIDLGITQSKVIPNPMSGSGHIFFENPNNELHKLFVFDATGKRVWDGKTNDEKFTISLSNKEETEIPSFNFTTTKYYYYITDNNGKKVSTGIFLDIKNQ